MARTARIVVPNVLHHIIQKGNNRQPVFLDQEDFHMFLLWLRDSSRIFKVAIHAYVLMDNYFQLLATPSDETGLARMMQWIGRYYVSYFNRKYGRTGTLWEGRFKTSVIDADRYFLACAWQIESSPVRAGIVASPGQYPWSSYAHHIGEKSSALITPHPVYWGLGNTPFAREAAYRHWIEHPLPAEELDAMNQALQAGKPLGSEQFLVALEKRINRRMRPGKRGRPFKNKPA